MRITERDDSENHGNRCEIQGRLSYSLGNNGQLQLLHFNGLSLVALSNG